jgi:hypothetical protein
VLSAIQDKSRARLRPVCSTGVCSTARSPTSSLGEAGRGVELGAIGELWVDGRSVDATIGDVWSDLRADAAVMVIGALADAGLGVDEVHAGALASVNRVVPFDAASVGAVDPDTLLLTSGVTIGFAHDARMTFVADGSWWAVGELRDEATFHNHIAPTFGAVPLARVDRTSLREWVAGLSDPDGSALAPATTIKAVQVFNKLMRAALEDRLIAANPVERLPLPKVEREEMRFLTADELRHLADTIDPRYRAFVLVAGYGGFRLGELLALRWKRVDLLRRQITITETLTDLAGQISFGPPKTKAAVRTVGLPAFVADELAQIAS